jgi:large subunit ribosomal protein L19
VKQIAQVEKAYLRDDLPNFSSGDTIKVHVRIVEGDKERIQVFQGTVIGRRGGGLGATFTVRKISSGIGVERTFPLYSPNIAKIEKVRTGQVRRGKLYYLRTLTGKSARIREQLTEMGLEKEGGEASKE